MLTSPNNSCSDFTYLGAILNFVSPETSGLGHFIEQASEYKYGCRRHKTKTWNRRWISVRIMREERKRGALSRKSTVLRFTKSWGGRLERGEQERERESFSATQRTWWSKGGNNKYCQPFVRSFSSSMNFPFPLWRRPVSFEPIFAFFFLFFCLRKPELWYRPWRSGQPNCPDRPIFHRT